MMLFLGMFIYFKQKHSPITLSISFLAFVSFIWLFFYSISYSVSVKETAFLLQKIGYTGIILIPVMWLSFIFSFMNVKFYKRIITIYSLLSFIFVISLWTTDYFVSGVYKYFWGYYPKAGILHPFYLLLILVTVSVGVYLLLKNWYGVRKETSLYKYRIQHILFGFIIYAFAIIDFVPNYGIEIYPFGWVCVVFFVAIIIYAILKYQLMDIKLIVKKAFFYSAGVGLVGGLITTITFLSYWFVANVPGFKFWTIPLLAAVITFWLGNLFWRKSKQVEKAYEVEKQARQELQHLNEVKDQFILATQHHLRTPLTIMKGYLSVILDKDQTLQTQTKDRLSRVSVSTDRLVKLVNELLDISQFQVGKQSLNLQSVNIRELIEEILKELQPDIQVKNLKIKIIPEDQNGWLLITADPEKLKIVLSNLIDNAVKYNVAQGSIIIQGQKTDSFFRISIKDIGIGINPEETSTLFTRYFERGEQAQKIYTTGRGIGLFIAASIVKAHNGKIWAESEGINKGATFYIELPL